MAGRCRHQKKRQTVGLPRSFLGGENENDECVLMAQISKTQFREQAQALPITVGDKAPEAYPPRKPEESLFDSLP